MSMIRYLIIDNTLIDKFKVFIPDEIVSEDERDVYIGATDGETVVGTLVVRVFEEGFAQLRWISIAKAFRRQGIATEFMEYLKNHLIELGISSLYSIVPFVKSGESDSVAEDFLMSQGASEIIAKKEIVTLSLEELQKKTGNSSSLVTEAIMIDELPEKMLTTFWETLEPDMRVNLDEYVEASGGDLVQAFECGSSFFVENDKIKGAMLFVPRMDEKGVVLRYMRATSAQVYAKMLKTAIFQIHLFYGDDALMTFAPLNGFGSAMGDLYKAEDSTIKIKFMHMSL